MTGPSWLPVLGIIATLLGGGGGITALLLVRRQGRRLNADTADVLSKTAITLVQPLEQRLISAETRAAGAERRADTAEERADAADHNLRLIGYQLDGMRRDVERLQRLLRQTRQIVMDPATDSNPAAAITLLRDFFAREAGHFQHGE